MKLKVSSYSLGLALVLFVPLGLCAQSGSHRVPNDSLKRTENQLIPEYWQSATIGQSRTSNDTEEAFNTGNLYDPWQLIQGRIAGVSITRPGGDPNGEFTIRIRGLNTLTQDWRPLVVLDGVAGVSMDNIDPNNVGSIQVLKEAAAAAIYGVRGANGVVIITSKRAKEGAPSVSAFASVSIDKVGKVHESLSADAFIAGGGLNLGGNTNWKEEMIQTGLTENLGFSVRQTAGGMSYSASVNYRDIEGLVGPSNRRTLNTSFFISQRAINDRLTLSVRVNSTNESRGIVSPLLFRYITLSNPTMPILDDINTPQDGGYFQQDLFDSYNPLALQNEQIFQQERKRLLTTGQFSFEVNPLITLRGQYTQDRFNQISGSYWSRYDYQIGNFNQGIAQRRSDDSFAEIADLSVHFNKRINDKIWIMADIGTGFVKTDHQGFYAGTTRYLFDSQSFNNLGAGANRVGFNAGSTSYKTEDRLNSYYGRVAVSYKESLNAFVNFRADSYSGFINDKTGLFYGMGLRYDVTSVMDAGEFNNLSLRMSYGVTGNLPRDPTLGRAIYGNGGIRDLDSDPNTTDDLFNNIQQLWNVNPELTWETVKEFNLGLDFSLGTFGITGTLDYFSRKSEDLLFQEAVPIGSPNVFAPNEFFTAASVYSNFFDLSSSGVEISLNYGNSKTSDEGIQWQSQVNAIFYQQPVFDRMGSAVGGSYEQLTGFGFLSRVNGTNLTTQHRLGQEVGGLYTPRFLGKLDDGTPLIDGQPFGDTDKVGNSLPSADLGIFNQFRKGNWELNMMLRGTFGHSLLNVTRMIHENTSFTGLFNKVTSDKDENLNSTFISDLYVENASFLRLHHMTISRNFDLGAKSTLNIALTGQNLFTLTGYEGIDPEVRYLDQGQPFEPYQALASGIASRELYYPSRTYTLSVRVSF